MLNDVETPQLTADTKKKQRVDNLIPFQQGVSGNPNGRPPKTTNRRTAYKRILQMNLDRNEIADFLAQGEITLKDGTIGKIPESCNIEEAMSFAQVSKAMTGDTKAFQAVRDELHGKLPTANVNFDATEALTSVLEQLGHVAGPPDVQQVDETDNTGAIDAEPVGDVVKVYRVVD